MSNEIAPMPPADPAVIPDRCPYCGAPLAKDYYFCLKCATPFQDVENVLPIVRPQRLTDGELVQMKAPHVHALFWTYFSVVFGAGLLSFVLEGSKHPEVTFVLSGAMILVTTCIFAAMHWSALTVQFKRFGFNQPAALWALLMLVPLLLVNYGYHEVFLKSFLPQDKSPFTGLRESGFGEAGIILFICLFPAVTEEIAFRGLVQHWLQIAIKPWHAMVFASFLFTVLHFSILSFPYLFLVGMLLGWAKWKTGSLYPSMLIHFLHNFVVIEFFSW